jgi:small subunit ribosomal protein S2e
VASLTEIFQFSIKIKEPQIVDQFFQGEELKDEVMDVKPVQRQTAAGQRTRFKAWVAVGDFKEHVGLGEKCATEVGIAIRGAFTLAKLSIVPVRKGYWGNMTGNPHTVPTKVTGKCGSCRVRLIPAPRGTGLVSAQATKKILSMAGLDDVYCRTNGQTKTTGNFAVACFLALRKTHKILTPDLWVQPRLTQNPLDKYPEKMVKQAR